MNTRLIFLFLFASLPAFADSSFSDSTVHLTPTEIATENKLLTGLGLNLHGQDFLSESPYEINAKPIRPFILPSHYYTDPIPPTQTVSSDDLLVDLDFLKYVFRMQYGGWETAETHGWDWNRWFDKWKAMLMEHKGQSMDALAAFAPFTELKQFQPDNHTLIGVNGGRAIWESGSMTALLKQTPEGTTTQLINDQGETFTVNPKDNATQPQKILFNPGDGNYQSMTMGYAISFPRNKGNVVAIVAGGKKIELIPDFDSQADGKQRLAAVLDLAQVKNDTTLYRRLAPGIGYVRMPDMSPANEESYTNLATNINKLSDGKERVLVVDLRNNHGGDLYTDHFQRWYSKKEMQVALSKAIARMTNKESFFAESLDWAERVSLGALKEPRDELVKDLQPIVDSLMKPEALSDKPTFSVTNGPPGSGVWNREFKPNQDSSHPILLILVDNIVASNGEYALGILTNLPNVLAAGISTKGVGSFGGVTTVVLPHTKIWVHVAISHNDVFRDKRSFDGYGVMPNLLLNTVKSNSAEYILQLAKSLAEMRR